VRSYIKWVTELIKRGKIAHKKPPCKTPKTGGFIKSSDRDRQNKYSFITIPTEIKEEIVNPHWHSDTVDVFF